MKKKIITIGIIALSAIFIVSNLKNLSQDAGLHDWHSNLQGYVEATRLQHVSAKPMAVFFYTDWCSSCKILREQVLSSPEVHAYLQNMITVKINPEASPFEETLAQEFGVMGYPTFFVISNNGRLVKQVERTTNITPQQFIEQLQQAVEI